MDIEMEELLQLQSSNIYGLDDGPSPPEEEEEIDPTFISRKNTCLNNDDRKSLLIDLFATSSDELLLPRGVIKDVCIKYKVSRSTVWRLWKDALQQKQNGEMVMVKNNRGLCGRKAKVCNAETLREVSLKQRTTMRSLAQALAISVATVHRLAQKEILRSHSNSIKPKLTEKHRNERLKFVLQFVIPPSISVKPKFNMLFNMIHIDEKWFFMTRTTQKFYLLNDEEDPYRTCQSKGFIIKVMFLGALARSRIDNGGDLMWDGKIGIFPFTEEVAAQRNSINRPKGTMETKPLQHITKDTIRMMVIETLIQQPPQSPDLNILDLGFFRAIQSIQHQAFPDIVPKLIESVEEAYNIYNPMEINYTWLTLMHVMLEIMKQKGGNNYKFPHCGKKKEV